MEKLFYTLRSQRIVLKDGLRCWETVMEKASFSAEETAVVIVDMWDRHWSAGATRRCGALAEKIDAVAKRARAKGMLVVNAPSDTMDFYTDAKGRKRFLDLAASPGVDAPPAARPVQEIPQPVDSSDGGSDSEDSYAPNTQVWTRQTDKIEIDQDRDLICGDEGEKLAKCFAIKGIKFIIYMGVHTNMCILNRSFAIKQMTSRGFKVCLARDLTDAMYNPAMPPYISHDEGTRLVIEYIEKFYCPTVESGEI